MSRYTIGVDFGTLSGRAVLVQVLDGTIIAQSVKAYTHAVMDKALPSGKKLGQDWALQHTRDYLPCGHDLTGLILGMTLLTRPEEMYRERSDSGTGCGDVWGSGGGQSCGRL